MNRTADGDQQEVVCRRELKRLANGAEYPVTVIVLAARQFRARHEDHFECAYQIKGLGSHLDLADQDTHTDKALGSPRFTRNFARTNRVLRSLVNVGTTAFP